MRPLTVMLPDDMVDDIEARVATGEYASASDLVREELDASLSKDPDVEDWLRGVVAPRCRARAIDRSPSIPAEDVLGRIQRRFAARYR